MGQCSVQSTVFGNPFEITEYSVLSINTLSVTRLGKKKRIGVMWLIETCQVEPMEALYGIDRR